MRAVVSSLYSGVGPQWAMGRGEGRRGSGGTVFFAAMHSLLHPKCPAWGGGVIKGGGVREPQIRLGSLGSSPWLPSLSAAAHSMGTSKQLENSGSGSLLAGGGSMPT